MCSCEICKRGRKIRAVLDSKDVERMASLIHELSEELDCVGLDLEVLKAKLNGAWPEDDGVSCPTQEAKP